MGATVAEALDGAVDALGAAGVETPRLDAELLLAAAIRAPRAELVLERERRLDGWASRRFAADVRRRLTREPVAYILGRRGFRRLELEVDPRVLIPRPETELLVELALELEPASALDVGTGSGAIALAVADELPDCAVVGYEPSTAALEVARANASRLGLASRVTLAAEPPRGRYGLLLANLPYVADSDWAGLAPEITGHEPRFAVTSGETGLEAIESLLGEVALGVYEVDAIGLELGEGQAPAVAELTRRAGFERVEVRADLAGIDRVVAGFAR